MVDAKQMPPLESSPEMPEEALTEAPFAESLKTAAEFDSASRPDNLAAQSAAPPREQPAPNEAPGDDYRSLPPEPSWVRFTPDLERVCRIAAQIRPDEPAPISYTALIIALLWADDTVSKWFQDYLNRHTSIDRNAIFTSKEISEDNKSRLLFEADRGTLPDTDPLYSRSARNLFDQAARIAREVARREPLQLTLDTRHLMAAYVFRNPVDHVDQVRGWGFDLDDWRRELKAFAESLAQQIEEDWSRLGSRPLGTAAPVIGSITADDPLAPPRDLLGVEEEAAAFARIAAAASLKPPLAIGVFGEWGSGKTFFMRRIYEGVQALSQDAAARAAAGHPAGPFLPDIVQIRFNAWHYIETNLWASLVEYIFTELDRWLQEKARGGQASAEQVFNRLATAQQLKLDALDSVITRRAERRAAELRAERARRAYEEASARAAAVGAGAYARALMQTLLEEKEVQGDLQRMADTLGAPELQEAGDRVLEVLSNARTESGRAQLIMQAGIARLGRGPWLAAVVVALVAVPLLAVGLRDAVAMLLGWPWLKNVQETVLALSGALAGAAAWGGALVRRSRAALTEVDKFDQKLRQQAEERQAKVASGPTAANTAAAEDELRKRKQSLEAAERALAEAEARLNEARSEFESASARSRLNAFIRAKATDGDYAKHLGIIAAIRRDFGQLAALMGAANNADEQKAEAERLADELYAAVERFCARLAKEPEVRLTPAEVRNLLALLEPAQAIKFLGESGRREQFSRWIDGAAALDEIEQELTQTRSVPLPRFSRIILYIDDLDRCPPKVVVDVLQAVHLLLCFPLFTVVVAVDARWVSRALHEQFPKLLGETGPFSPRVERIGAGASSHDYLEKIFQIPYWVRPVDAQSAQRYVNTLVEPDVRRVAVSAAIGGGDGEGVSSAAGKGGARGAGDAGSSAAAAGAAGKAGVARDHAAASPAAAQPGPPPTAAAVGLELTRWEADALERFAPLIGATPRRLIRFVNLYRLLKTGMASEARDKLVGERGESDTYRALIVQLAIVTGAPDAAPLYFKRLEEMNGTGSLEELTSGLHNWTPLKDVHDREIILRVLDKAREWPGAKLEVATLLATAPTARRYSFTAWSR